MATVLTLVDEQFGSGTSHRTEPVELKLETDRVSVREILRRRIAEEVALLNGRRKAMAEAHQRARNFLVKRGTRTVEPRLLDVEEELAPIVTAFEKRRFLMLVDDRQIESLEEEVSVTGARELVFLHLTPLKGG